MKIRTIAASVAAFVMLSCCGIFAAQEENDFREFMKQYTEQVAPIEKAANTAEWNAYLTGKKEDYEKAASESLKLDMIHSSGEKYRQLTDWRDCGAIENPLLQRQLEILLNKFGEKQVSADLLKQIKDQEAKVNHLFNNYRGKIDGKTVTERDIYDILQDSTDRQHREKAWEAQKGVGPLVEKELLELVRLRNRAAAELGFANYYEMSVAFDEQNLKELTNIFEKLAEMSEKPFLNYKSQLDEVTAQKLGISKDRLMPWDYANPFFQSADGVFYQGGNEFFRDIDIPATVKRFYDGAGMPLKHVYEKSDLYEKAGKSQHAFCFHLDRGDDVRIMMNIRQDEDSCSTLLHESGHAVYDLYINPSMPWIFRDISHILTTESIAMTFELMTKNPSWLTANVQADAAAVSSQSEAMKREMALQELIFCRWTIVMFNFERQLYANPDQDLNKLWWDTVAKYQNLKVPEGRNQADWASKIHFTSSPVYYHNYMMGRLMSSQLLHTLGTKVGNEPNWKQLDFTGKPEYGKWLIDNIFAPGAKYRWDELLERATGETLNPKYFSEQFID